MTGPMHALRSLLTGGLILSSFVTASAAEPGQLPCTATKGSAATELAHLAAETRAGDTFYRQLSAWSGAPSNCTGRIKQTEDGPDSLLRFTWPDRSMLEMSSLPPETYAIHYRNSQGLPHADAVLKALRAYAAGQGLRVDWSKPVPGDEPEQDGAARVVEYRDPEPGTNGIVRLGYDQHDRLVAVSLSIAL